MKLIDKILDRLCMAIYLRGRRVWRRSPDRAVLVERERRDRALRRLFPITETRDVRSPEGSPASVRKFVRFPGSKARPLYDRVEI